MEQPCPGSVVPPSSSHVNEAGGGARLHHDMEIPAMLLISGFGAALEIAGRLVWTESSARGENMYEIHS